MEAILKYILSDLQLHFSVLPQFWGGVQLVIMNHTDMFSSLRSVFTAVTVYLVFLLTYTFIFPTVILKVNVMLC